MKKFLFFIIFSVVSFGFSDLKAQSSRSANTVSQKTDDGVLVAYPNPTKDVLFIKSKDNNSKIKSVSFFTILGVQVAEYNINTNSSELRLDKLRPGKYLMRYILDDNTQKITQIIKQ